MSELKTCPFCGGEAEIKPYTSRGLIIRCKSCLMGLRQKTLYQTTEWLELKLIENWNKRTNEL